MSEMDDVTDGGFDTLHRHARGFCVEFCPHCEDEDSESDDRKNEMALQHLIIRPDEEAVPGPFYSCGCEAARSHTIRVACPEHFRPLRNDGYGQEGGV